MFGVLRCVFYSHPQAPVTENPRAVLGIDGGNTKSLAVVADLEGAILGWGSGGCSDIYGAESEEAALRVATCAAQRALDEAGISARSVAVTVAGMAGADWPEDYELYQRELRERLSLTIKPIVFNDGLAPIRIGSCSGLGVGVVIGTGCAIGARGPGDRSWHAGFWLLGLGAIEALGTRALRAACHAALGLQPETRLTRALVELAAADNVTDLLHRVTRRAAPLAKEWFRAAGQVLLDLEGDGDATAVNLVSDYAVHVADYVALAPSKVGIREIPFTTTVTGGVLRHPTTSLPRQLEREIRRRLPLADICQPQAPPVAGAILEALAMIRGSLSEEVRHRVLGELAMMPALVAG